eukprot:6683521-Alexandrium_andersonii.AAC.1
MSCVISRALVGQVIKKRAHTCADSGKARTPHTELAKARFMVAEHSWKFRGAPSCILLACSLFVLLHSPWRGVSY